MPALRTQPMMFPKWGTLLTYGRALVIRMFLSPSTGSLNEDACCSYLAQDHAWLQVCVFDIHRMIPLSLLWNSTCSLQPTFSGILCLLSRRLHVLILLLYHHCILTWQMLHSMTHMHAHTHTLVWNSTIKSSPSNFPLRMLFMSASDAYWATTSHRLGFSDISVNHFDRDGNLALIPADEQFTFVYCTSLSSQHAFYHQRHLKKEGKVCSR